MAYFETVIPPLPYGEDAIRLINKKLAGKGAGKDDGLVWFDLETTGLSSRIQEIYLIGCISLEKGEWKLRQWFSERKEEEALILQGFLDWLQGKTVLVSFNGDAFDIPFLAQRCFQHGILFDYAGFVSLDLYKELKKMKKLLGLGGTRQVHFEKWLGLEDRKAQNGGECVKRYRQYRRSPSDTILQLLITHNREDLEGLAQLGILLSCQGLQKGDVRLLEARKEEEGLLCLFALDAALPGEITLADHWFRLVTRGGSGEALIVAQQGRCRLYHEDYKNYDYLPSEDMAIHKSLSSFMDLALKVPATRQNCYTWVDCTGELAADKEKAALVLRSNLICRLNGAPG